ncbi:MAG: hypothetical protein UV36_C0004G0013 [Parcubacteria group bacterium GW2011_GWC2_42_6]|nr:MAG: hypothetical protein UU87_C0003G0117 [Parcubacteria group bacterium GW2011_GWA2_42_11]KKS67688.1 MAG: hypothetical protein UV36_C0004G0013 [Parcubacteria group bacterium GW2011_GWC2_42_6]KKT76445.1 MAG: hypothetical protein UW72_C0005G0013 [Parcubacteria group bacterium GW2011_GWF2_44_7]
MMIPSIGFEPRNFGKLGMVGVIEIGRKILEIGQIIVGVAVMWGIFFIISPLAVVDKIKNKFRKRR